MTLTFGVITKFDKNNGYFTQRPMRIYDTVSMYPS